MSKHTYPPRLEDRVSIDGVMPMRDLVPMYWLACDACLEERKAARAAKATQRRSEE